MKPVKWEEQERAAQQDCGARTALRGFRKSESRGASPAAAATPARASAARVN